MSNPNLEPKVKELLELKRMREELDAEINVAEEEIKQAMGTEETLLAGAFKVTWKAITSSRLDSTALKKALPEIAAQFMKQTTTRAVLVASSCAASLGWKRLCSRISFRTLKRTFSEMPSSSLSRSI